MKTFPLYGVLALFRHDVSSILLARLAENFSVGHGYDLLSFLVEGPSPLHIDIQDGR